MRSQKETLAEVRSTLKGLAPPDGCAGLLVLAVGHGCLWELCAVSRGASPASTASLARFAEAWGGALTLHGFAPVMAPRGVPCADIPLVAGAEAFTEGALQVQVRSFKPDYGAEPLQVLRSIETVREDSEQAVVRLGAALNLVLTTSRNQCEEISRVVRQFEDTGADGSASLSGALHALEDEVQQLGTGLQDRLDRQRKEAEGAAGWAKDIIGLASSVENIAQSARVLTFNARIESARLGAQGKGFVVIANAIRELANDVRNSNEVVTKLATDLAAVLPSLEHDTTELGHETERRLKKLGSRLESVRTSFELARGQTLDGLRSSELAARSIHEKSNLVIQDLQYQDRASQLLQHAAEQVRVLERVLGADEEAPEERAEEAGRKVPGQATVLEQSAVELF